MANRFSKWSDGDLAAEYEGYAIDLFVGLTEASHKEALWYAKRLRQELLARGQRELLKEAHQNARTLALECLAPTAHNLVEWA